EWQLVASTEFSAAQCYNDLTAMLISWRRLELSTWARLLDIEKEKCNQDASSWWFVAYDVIVATPLRLVQSGNDLANYSEELISTLENFLRSTSMGQFSPRLKLSENFVLLLQLLANDFPALSQVESSLANLLQHYAPFVSIFDRILCEGRVSLEHDIKQEI